MFQLLKRLIFNELKHKNETLKQILRTDITCTRVHARAREWNIDRRE